MYNDRVKALFDRIFVEVEKGVKVRNNVKWFDSETKQLQSKCRKYEKKWHKTKKIEDKEAYKQIRRGYNNKLEFAKKNYLNMKIGEFKGNGQKLFNLMYDIIRSIKENVLPEVGTSEQDLVSKILQLLCGQNN